MELIHWWQKWLGLDKSVDPGRSAIRGIVEFPNGHGLEAKVFQYFGNGVRQGVIPCGSPTLYWFLTYAPSVHGKPVISPYMELWNY